MQVDQELIEHMSNPHNYGILEEADGIGIGENPENGEKVIVYLKSNERGGSFSIEEIRFQAIACMTTVVAGSIITQEAKGLDFYMAEDLVAVTLGMLEQVPPAEAACSEMVAVALKAAMDSTLDRKEHPEHPAIVYKITQSCTDQPVSHPIEMCKESTE